MSAHERASPIGRALHWIFDSRLTGRVTVAQVPNVWLWIALGTLIGERLAPTEGAARHVLAGAKAASLTIWALDEIARGVNPWRRFLGAAVIAYEAMERIPKG